MMIFVLFYLSCDGLLAVGIAILLLSLSDCPHSLVRLGLVMAITVFSLLTHLFICSFINHTVLISENCFIIHNHICLVFLTNIWLELFNRFYTLHIKFLIWIVYLIHLFHVHIDSILLGLAKGVRMHAVWESNG